VNDSLSNLAFLVAPVGATAILTKNVHAVGILPLVGSIAALAVGFRLFTRPEIAAEPEPA
jgi:hypothetical protein